MTEPSWTQTCPNLPHFLPYGHLAQLEHFPLEKKMFAVLTFSSPKGKCFLPGKPAQWRVRKTFSFGEEKVRGAPFNLQEEM